MFSISTYVHTLQYYIIHIFYSWFHIIGTWSVHSFNGDYLSIYKCLGSCSFFMKSPVQNQMVTLDSTSFREKIDIVRFSLFCFKPTGKIQKIFKQIIWHLKTITFSDRRNRIIGNIRLVGAWGLLIIIKFYIRFYRKDCCLWMYDIVVWMLSSTFYQESCAINWSTLNIYYQHHRLTIIKYAI